MSNTKPIVHGLLAVFLIGCVTPMMFGGVTVPPQQTSLEQLKAKFQKQYDDRQFENGPSTLVFPVDKRQRLRRWQDELAHLFAF